MYPIAPHWLNYIDGEWCDSTQRLTVNNPGTAEPLATIPPAPPCGFCRAGTRRGATSTPPAATPFWSPGK